VFSTKTFGFAASVLILGLTFIAFQNCARTEFAQAEDKVSFLKTEGSDFAGVDNETGVDPNAPAPDVELPAPEASPTPMASATPKSNPKNDSPGRPSKVADVSSLIECELGHPNKKVVFGTSFAPGSNASSTRVCMSEDSCLKVINAYAAVRDCALNLGPASSSASPNSQCTKIFPGSKGTCHNAKVMSDQEIASVLQAMGK
jgi:hypothetical protein